MYTYISDTSHFKEVLSRVLSVKHLLWIGTADIKDLYVDVGNEKKPFLSLIAQLIRRGVEVRLIHAKEPGPNFREDFDKYPVLYDRLDRSIGATPIFYYYATICKKTQLIFCTLPKMMYLCMNYVT